jgi:hypothetical protein
VTRKLFNVLSYPSTVYRKHDIRDFDTPRFMFYVYGFDLLDRICLVFIVLRIYPHTRRSMESNQRLFQGYPRRVTSIPFLLNRDHPHLPQTTYRKHSIMDFEVPRFMFYVHGFDLSDRIWLVSFFFSKVITN